VLRRPVESGDYWSSFLATLANTQARAAHPALKSWAQTTRLNPLSEIALHANDPGVVDAGERIKRFGAAAASNLVKLLGRSAASHMHQLEPAGGDERRMHQAKSPP